MSATVALEGRPETAESEEAVTTAEAVAAEATLEQKETKGTKEETEPTKIEQKEAKEAKEEEAVNGKGQENTLTPPLSQREREAAAAKVKESSLPPVLKERLSALVESSGEAATDGKVRVPVEEAIRAVEETLPDFLRSGATGARQPEHPGGDAFFSGEAGELSDAQAEELARGQLARSGLLRGQRARVAE